MITTYDQDGFPVISPQPGPQTAFCACQADICIYGGAAYGGKSVCLLLEGSRYTPDPDFTGVIFRRKYTEIIDGGGLWDTSEKIYPALGGHGVRGNTEWMFPSGSKIKMNHLNQEANIYDHQGAAYVYIGFDELTHFTAKQFWYLMSRNRPPAGCTLRPYCRATCNPEPGWVADLIQWWWDPETGYAIPERSGVIRYFTRFDNEIVWVSPDWRDEFGNPPRSLTFIASSIDDNPLGVAADPTYKANLLSQDRVTRERLLRGNWLITEGGNMFDERWFNVVDELPGPMRTVRYWDFAASEVSEKDKNDPDWTAGALCGVYNNELYIIDMQHFREKPGKSETLIRNIAEQDGYETEVSWEEEKGSSGKFTSEYLKKVFDGFPAEPDPVSGNKVERAKPWAAWAEFGRVHLVRGEWNRKFLQETGKFPDGKRDQVDAVSGAFKRLVGPKRVLVRYIPAEYGHFRDFKCSSEEFEKLEAKDMQVYIALCADKDGGIYGAAYAFGTKNRRLKQYAEFFHPQSSVRDVANDIKSRINVFLEPKGEYVYVNKILGSEEFFQQGKNLAGQFRKEGIRIRRDNKYDETGAINKANRLFAEDRIRLHTSCVESDVQWRNWAYDKGRPGPGYPMARCLCMVVSELRSTGQLEQGMIAPVYSKYKQAVREKLKSTPLHQTPDLSAKRSEYDYLV